MKTLIRNGRLIDPANRVDGRLNLLLKDGRVAWVGCGAPEADLVVDAQDRIVAPGFIDIHMHEDPVDADGRIRFNILNCMLRMGVTTVLGGNCGINEADPVEYLNEVDRAGAPVNVALLAGHEYFRVAAGATDKYAASTPEQRRAMVEGIRRALEGGCMGVSFGLRYVPGTDEDEFYRAAECCRDYGGMIAAHVRDDADQVFAAIDEIARAGQRFGLPVQISHIGSMGGFGQMEQVLRQTDALRLNGLDVALDCYPYTAFSTRIGATTYDDGWLERYRCDYSALEFCEGPYCGQRATAETFAEMRRDFPECITVCHVMKPEEIARAFRHPAVMVASDGLLDGDQGHPRAAGTFPRFLAEYARTGALDWYSAVEKLTALPATRLHLARKGRLNVGADADVVIFDPATVRDCASFDLPTLPPVGVDRVFIGGREAVRDGEILNARCGWAVRR